MMLYDALQTLDDASWTLFDALQGSTNTLWCSTMLYDALQTLLWCSMNTLWCSTRLYKHSMMLYDALQCSLTVSTMLYNALQYSKMIQNIKWSWLTRSLPGTFRESSGNLSETFHGSSGDRLEIFRIIPGAVTAVRFYFWVASGTSSGFPSRSCWDPSGNAHSKAII